MLRDVILSIFYFFKIGVFFTNPHTRSFKLIQMLFIFPSVKMLKVYIPSRIFENVNPLISEYLEHPLISACWITIIFNPG